MHLDVNECEVLNGGCQHQCKNTNGSYVSQCNKGFFLDGNGKTCSGKLDLKPFQPNAEEILNGKLHFLCSESFLTNL